MEDVPTLLVQDESGRTLLTYLEHLIPLDGVDYALLSPVDAPVYLFAWDDEDEDAEPRLVEEDEELQAVLPTAKAVMEERDLSLLETAVVLTVEGDIPELESEEMPEDEEEGEAFLPLATFYNEETEYSLAIPLDGIYVMARIEDGQATLLGPDELEAVGPQLEAILEERLG